MSCSILVGNHYSSGIIKPLNEIHKKFSKILVRVKNIYTSILKVKILSNPSGGNLLNYILKFETKDKTFNIYWAVTIFYGLKMKNILL
jgi:hypothetical protein